MSGAEPLLSAGLLVYRRVHRGQPARLVLEVLIGHMGGPFWARKDAAAWSIPKGELMPGEDPMAAARREFEEELGGPAPNGPRIDLGTVRQSSGKLVRVWATEGEFDAERIEPGTFTLEWPRGSGVLREFPEIDRVAWYELPTAGEKLVKGQRPFLDRLRDAVG